MYTIEDIKKNPYNLVIEHLNGVIVAGKVSVMESDELQLPENTTIYGNIYIHGGFKHINIKAKNLTVIGFIDVRARTVWIEEGITITNKMFLNLDRYMKDNLKDLRCGMGIEVKVPYEYFNTVKNDITSKINGLKINGNVIRKTEDMKINNTYAIKNMKLIKL